MKKLLRLLFVFFGIFVALQSATIVKADGKFTIKKYNVEANIQKDGNVDLTQRVTYDFDGEFHGVYYNQDIRGIDGAGQPTVEIDDGGKVSKLQQADTGKDNTFKVTKTKRRMDIKVYHYTVSERLTFIYKYRLYGVITNYLDTAEMNWKIVGNGWDNELNNIRLSVNLPQKNVPQLKAWTHGPLSGHNQVDRKNGRVVMTLDTDPANQSIESHIIFPTSVTPDNKKVVKKNAKAAIMAHEKKLAQEANSRRTKQKWIYGILMVVGALVLVAIYIYQFMDLKRHPANKHKIPTPLYHLFDEPKFNPSFTQVILERKTKAESLGLTGDLLNEVGHRRMKIDKDGKSYDITALVPPTNEFMKYLFDKIGDGKMVQLKQIRHYARQNNDEVVDKFDKWAEDAARGREKYLDLDNIARVGSFKGAAISADIVLAIMFAISLVMRVKLAIVAPILIVLGLGVWGIHWYMKKKITPYTDLGEEEVNKIRAFKRMLEDINDIKLAQVGDIVLWESFLPYAVVFGVSDQVIRAMKLNFGVDKVNASPVAYYYIGNSSFVNKTTGFQTAFINSIAAGGSSSISGGSGGFSGGGSGGFGGGSGGGAF